MLKEHFYYLVDSTQTTLIVFAVKTEPREAEEVPDASWWNCEDVEAIRAAYYKLHNSS